MGNILSSSTIVRRRQALKNWHDERATGFEKVKFRLRNSTTTPERRADIAKMSLAVLCAALLKEEITATEALETYVECALLAQERLNCCIEFIDEAWDTAEKLDAAWKGRQDKPPLFGVPFSVKGNFFLSGYKCSIGLAKFLDEKKTEEGIGAVPFVRTNVPQALLSFVCSNSVNGTTGNPHDPNRTPGGSSGGEAALLVAGGTPFGTGSDLAGSLRIPASMCGCVSLKPTEARLAVLGTHGAPPERTRLAVGFGYFTHTVQEQIDLLRLTIGDEAYCKRVPASIRLPLVERRMMEDGSRKLRIGYFESDGFLDPTPAQQRAVRIAVQALKNEGHTLIPFGIPKPAQAAKIVFRSLSVGIDYTKHLFDADVVDPYLRKFSTLLHVPNWVRGAATPLIRLLSPQFATVTGSYVQTAEDVLQVNAEADAYRDLWNERWTCNGLDALICPSFVVPAVPHRFPSDLLPCAFATALYNVLNLPVGVVPVGKVSEEDDAQLENDAYYPVGYNIVLRTIREAARNSRGMPIAVQVVDRAYDEETCLLVMRHIERSVQYNGNSNPSSSAFSTLASGSSPKS